jgi:dephospho-CoA kinase
MRTALACGSLFFTLAARMKIIGLTGGIGMGKSTSATLMRERGVPVVDTDDLARELVEPGQPALEEIRAAFGEKVIGPDGRLRRDELARVAFADPEARKQVEAILHPPIRERWRAQVDAWRKEGKALAVVVIPLLYETKAEADFDAVICAACTAPTQRERLIARGWSGQEIDRRNAAQIPVPDKISRANYVIWTEGDLEAHASQLDRILASLSGQSR